MGQEDKIQLFEDKRIRTAWDEDKEEWYFSVVDVVAVLTDQPDQRGASNYWAKLKQRLKDEGADQLLTNCQQLKLRSPKDGKRYNTDVADTEQLLRIIQSIPSPKAEPFKLWRPKRPRPIRRTDFIGEDSFIRLQFFPWGAVGGPGRGW